MKYLGRRGSRKSLNDEEETGFVDDDAQGGPPILTGSNSSASGTKSRGSLLGILRRNSSKQGSGERGMDDDDLPSDLKKLDDLGILSKEAREAEFALSGSAASKTGYNEVTGRQLLIAAKDATTEVQVKSDRVRFYNVSMMVNTFHDEKSSELKELVKFLSKNLQSKIHKVVMFTLELMEFLMLECTLPLKYALSSMSIVKPMLDLINRGEKFGGMENLEAMEKSLELIQDWGLRFSASIDSSRGPGKEFVTTYKMLRKKGQNFPKKLNKTTSNNSNFDQQGSTSTANDVTVEFATWKNTVEMLQDVLDALKPDENPNKNELVNELRVQMERSEPQILNYIDILGSNEFSNVPPFPDGINLDCFLKLNDDIQKIKDKLSRSPDPKSSLSKSSSTSNNNNNNNDKNSNITSTTSGSGRKRDLPAIQTTNSNPFDSTDDVFGFGTTFTPTPTNLNIKAVNSAPPPPSKDTPSTFDGWAASHPTILTPASVTSSHAAQAGGFFKSDSQTFDPRNVPITPIASAMPTMQAYQQPSWHDTVPMSPSSLSSYVNPANTNPFASWQGGNNMSQPLMTPLASNTNFDTHFVFPETMNNNSSSSSSSSSNLPRTSALSMPGFQQQQQQQQQLLPTVPETSTKKKPSRPPPIPTTEIQTNAPTFQPLSTPINNNVYNLTNMAGALPTNNTATTNTSQPKRPTAPGRAAPAPPTFQ